MPSLFRVLGCLLVVLAGCASEDPNLVDPSPASTGIKLRFINAGADGVSRRVLLERGFQTSDVADGSIAAVIPAPADSSFIEVVTSGRTEYRTEVRSIFTRNVVTNLIALPAADGQEGIDTVVVRPVLVPFVPVPVASVRLMHAVPDTTRSFTMRLGCPSGRLLTPGAVTYRNASQYADLPPGPTVLSILERSSSGMERTVGLYSATLRAGTSNMIVLQGPRTQQNPTITFIEETDTSSNSVRPLEPVTTLTGELKVVNFSSTAASVRLADGTVVSSNVAPLRTGSAVSVPTCSSLSADRVTVELSDGRTATDSASLAVRRRTTALVADDGSDARLILIGEADQGVGTAGMARIRVVNLHPSLASITVSVGGRTNANSPNGLSAGIALATAVGFGNVSAVSAVAPGELPMTVSTSTIPTTIVDVSRANVEADGDYLLVVTGTDADVVCTMVERSDVDGALSPLPEAAMLRYVNAVPDVERLDVSIGTVVSGARIFYGNSVATSVPSNGVEVTAGTIGKTVPTRVGERTLVVSTDRGGSQQLLSFMTAPLPTQAGASYRRMLNAASDLDFVSVAYDSINQGSLEQPHLFRDVFYGELSTIDLVTASRRGSLVFYAKVNDRFVTLFTLPQNYIPIGSNSTLIVTGNASRGYNVIVLQEF
ncbi:MAG: DUF4397 domain-containing protein [Candidatus Kapabacteria bacterium]|nr:DUF4397 domain-containing protein [Candidatus Kapabacteria bacterium]